ncbi:propanediol/glycerol family dehydratase large subunit [Carnobacterium maltaromaticum]
MRSKRFEVLAQRPVNQDGLIGEWPDLKKKSKNLFMRG